MYQDAVNIAARVRPERLQALEQLLSSRRDPRGANALLPFDQLGSIHFARVVLLPASQQSADLWIPPTLVLAAEVDGPADSTVMELVRLGRDGIDALFQHCEEYPQGASITDPQRFEYLQRHSLKVQAHYVNTIGRTVSEVGRNASLRRAIESYVDGRKTAPSSAKRSATEIRKEIQDHVGSRPDLAWALARESPKRPSKFWGYIALAIAALPVLLFVALALAFPVLLLIPLFLLLVLRLHEVANVPHNYRPSNEHVQLCGRDEDHLTQNQLSAIGYVQKGIFRRALLRTMLWVLALTSRHLYNRGHLSGVDTIHFARWVLLDSDRRLYFMSNYDGSSETYMDDFVDRVAFGLNIVFGNGQGWPRTRFLIGGGAKNEQAFKAYFRSHQVPTHLWYVASAYDGLTAMNIMRDEKIRAGLAGEKSEEQAAEWLPLL